jgi:phage N-6-adenine-methyltransferase
MKFKLKKTTAIEAVPVAVKKSHNVPNSVGRKPGPSEVGTPDWLFNYMQETYAKGKFDIDLAASAANAKCANYYTIEDNALVQDWTEGRTLKTGFCNPPYARGKAGDKINPGIEGWLLKAMNEGWKGFTTVFILPVRTNTWWNRIIFDTDNQSIREGWFVEFLSKRVKFVGASWQAPFDCMIVVRKGTLNEKPKTTASSNKKTFSIKKK